ncbi:hypothetical protein [Streptomyces sp. NPDC016845]|uniref:hypothetical protein n=1 Tax=Streptomyces sp. NPDC016845 TaxID=3364972 RepID=UPI0037A13F06
MNDARTDEVRDLLARAAEQAGHPSLDTAAVFAKASRVRRRHCLVLAGAALAAVAGGLVTVAGMTPGKTERPPAAASSPARTELTGGSGREQKLAGLLPAETGKIEEVSLPMLVKDADLASSTSDDSGGALDGSYAVRRDGGVGYLRITLRDRAQLEAKTPDRHPLTEDLCAQTETPRAECVREKLSENRVLTIWRQPREHNDSATLAWGEELTGQLALPDGRVLFIHDSTGFRGHGQLGPLLRTPPLTRTQLRTLILQAELVTANPV